MDDRNFEYLHKWDQDALSKKAGYPDGMCLIWSFHFGVMRMIMADPRRAMQEVLDLSMGKREPLLGPIKEIGFGYSESYCYGLNEAVTNIAIQYEGKQLFPKLTYQIKDYATFDIEHISSYGVAGMHGTMVNHFFKNYYLPMRSTRFLVIGATFKDLGKHAMCLVVTPEEEIVIFEPNFGLLKINSLLDFFEDYGVKLQVTHWELILVELC